MQKTTSTGLLGLALLALLALACSSIQVRTDYDPAADFTGLAHYAWLPGLQPATGDPRVDNSLLDSRVRSAVDKGLAARGYTKALGGRTDFWVGYHVALEDKLDVDTIDSYAGRPGWGPRVSQTVVREYQQGTLLLDLIDPATRKLIWRGSAQARVTPSASPRERQERVDEAVRLMLERFPPSPGT